MWTKDFNRINPHKETDRNAIVVAGFQLTHFSQYHALPGNGLPQALVQSARMNPVVEPSKCLSNMIAFHQDVTGMTGKMTPEGWRILVRNCVKTVLFCRLKFFKKDLHGIYDQRETTVCGLVIKSCNLSGQDATLKWWATMRKIVIATHTDHRNNVIKTMRLRFRGTFQSCGELYSCLWVLSYPAKCCLVLPFYNWCDRGRKWSNPKL